MAEEKKKTYNRQLHLTNIKGNSMYYISVKNNIANIQTHLNSLIHMAWPDSNNDELIFITK